MMPDKIYTFLKPYLNKRENKIRLFSISLIIYVSSITVQLIIDANWTFIILILGTLLYLIINSTLMFFTWKEEDIYYGWDKTDN